MQALINLAKRAQSLSVDDLIRHLSEQKEFTDLIIELNTQKQLFEKGIDSKGRTLESIGGPYATNTIEGTVNYKGKKELGLPYDHITLFNTGEFYESWRVFLQNGTLTIAADTIKTDIYEGTTDLIADWGADILGLTQESLSILRDKALEILIPYVKKRLLA